MQTVKVEGKQVRYWDFEHKEKQGDVEVTVPGYVSKDSEISIQVPENITEVLEVANQDEKRVCELVRKGLEAEAEDKAGSTPAGTFSVSMISGADKAFKASPQFAGIKKSKERKEALMRWISTSGMKDVMLATFESLRNVKNRGDENEDES